MLTHDGQNVIVSFKCVLFKLRKKFCNGFPLVLPDSLSLSLLPSTTSSKDQIDKTYTILHFIWNVFFNTKKALCTFEDLLCVLGFCWITKTPPPPPTTAEDAEWRVLIVVALFVQELLLRFVCRETTARLLHVKRPQKCKWRLEERSV